MCREGTPTVLRQDSPVHGLPVDMTLFSANETGARFRRTDAKRMKLLENVEFLGRFLTPDERILFITTACSPFERQERRAHGSSYLLVAKRCILVFTNRRIIHIPTTPKYAYRGSLAEILYQDCTGLNVKGTSLRVEYRAGYQEEFRCIPKADTAIITRVNVAVPGLAASSPFPERKHLCPSCMHILCPDIVT